MNSQPELRPLPAEKPPLTDRALILGGNLAGLAVITVDVQLAEDIFNWVDRKEHELQQSAVQE